MGCTNCERLYERRLFESFFWNSFLRRTPVYKELETARKKSTTFGRFSSVRPMTAEDAGKIEMPRAR
jgi:hypothetical protein